MGLSDAPGSPLKTGLSVLGEYSLSPRGLCLYLDDSALPHSPAPPISFYKSSLALLFLPRNDVTSPSL